jgi:hypothetical protein
MITRRNCLIGAAATWTASWVSAPNLVRAANLMAIRGTVMSIQPNYYGFCDRMWINQRYRSGELRGRLLLRLIDEGVLRHIPAPQLLYDLARWKTAELSLSARQERAAFFDYGTIGQTRPITMLE